MIVKPITVLLPTYRKTKFNEFKKSIDSITLYQSVIPKEIIVLIDGPVDIRIIRYIRFLNKTFKKSNLKTIKFPFNNGLGKVLNVGVKKSSYNLILRCDSDDISRRHRIKHLYKYYNKNKNLSVIDSSMLEYDSKSSRIRYFNKKQKNSLSFFKYRNAINHPTTLLKKSDILKVGNYEHVPFFEDYYLWIKLLQKNFKFGGISKILVETNIDESFYKRRSGLNYLKKYKFFLQKCLNINFINRYQYFILLLVRSLIIMSNKRIIGFFYKNLMRKK
jgi:glycosyltransferase involved in cell wall biosynthesis